MSARHPLADIQFISEFAAFCRSKPKGEEYDYSSNNDCACAQFLIATGRSKCPMVAEDWDDDNGVSHMLPDGLDGALSNRGGGSQGWTWGALAGRLESLIATSPVVVKS